VSVSRERTSTNAAVVLTIIWNELGGPPTKAPVRRGYGSSLVRDLIPHELGGTVDLTFPSDGFGCKIEIPLEGGPEIRRVRSARD
jgi:two-component sensor histidine kinase